MKNLVIIASFWLAACSSSTGGTTGQGTTGIAASSTSGAAGASTGAMAGSTSGGSTGNPTGGGNSSGSSTGKAASVPCAPNADWSGDLCLLTSCAALANTGQPCQLSDGGVGACIGGSCDNGPVSQPIRRTAAATDSFAPAVGFAAEIARPTAAGSTFRARPVTVQPERVASGTTTAHRATALPLPGGSRLRGNERNGHLLRLDLHPAVRRSTELRSLRQRLPRGRGL